MIFISVLLKSATYLIPFFSFILILNLGLIITSRISYKLPKSSIIFFSLVSGCIIFTAFIYFLSLIFGFHLGVILGQIIIFFSEIIYLLYQKPKFGFIKYLKSFLKEKYLLILLIFFGIPLIILFTTHIIPNIDGNLYTGDSTYGDLPFHLSIISQIAYNNILPPQNPFYSEIPLVYPFLTDFFSAILVFEGMSLRNAVLIPGIILSLSIVGLLYDFGVAIMRDKLKSFIFTILYLLNGGIGFLFFLKDYSFNIEKIFIALLNPGNIKEYSYLFSENIQWVNFLSRIIVPERSVLLGIPAGLIILRLLFFREGKSFNKFEFIFIAFIFSLLPLLHTHTFLVFAIIIPLLAVCDIFKNFSIKIIKFYFLMAVTVFIMTIPYFSIFMGHLENTSKFLILHFGWMSSENESIFWFWFKNSYLYIPISLLALFVPKVFTRNTKILVFGGLILFILVNIILFSPYNWDNVKLLFWAGLFFSLAASELFVFLFQKKNLLITLTCIVIIFTMTSSALLSLRREINIKYVLFSKNDIKLGEIIKTQTPRNSLFLTYKIHNSPANNLAGRRILMGYPGSLWVHGINYSGRETDINKILQGDLKAKTLLDIYKINYVLLEKNNSAGIIINRDFFTQYPLFYSDTVYNVYKID